MRFDRHTDLYHQFTDWIGARFREARTSVEMRVELVQTLTTMLNSHE